MKFKEGEFEEMIISRLKGVTNEDGVVPKRGLLEVQNDILTVVRRKGRHESLLELSSIIHACLLKVGMTTNIEEILDKWDR